LRPSAYEQFARLEREHWWFRGRRRVYLELLRGALDPPSPRRVLDIGAGVGGFLEELGGLGGTLHCTERDPGALRLCQERGLAHCLRADASALPYANESFDLITLFDVLEHLDDDGHALREVQRVLAPGGLVLTSVPAYPWLFSHNDVVAEHRRRYTRSGLREVHQRSGLHLLRLTHANALLFPPIAMFLLASRARRWLAPSDRERTNLSWRLPHFLDELAYRAFCAELAVSKRGDLPFGHSLVAIAQRRDVELTPLPRRSRPTKASNVKTEFAAGAL
jgi:SAM-dependent methyltransferase